MGCLLLVAYGLLLLIAVTATRASFVSRNGSSLVLEGSPFRFGGANIYWLGLDENGPSGVAYPSVFRQADALNATSQMGMRVSRACSHC